MVKEVDKVVRENFIDLINSVNLINQSTNQPKFAPIPTITRYDLLQQQRMVHIRISTI